MKKIILKFLLKNGVIRKDELDVYEYGTEMLINYLLFGFCQIILMIIFNGVISGTIFWAMFIMLRRYGGGYHANSKISCFIMSNMLYVIYVLFYNMEIAYIYKIILLIAAIIIIYALVPIDNFNNRLTNDEKTKYRKRTLIVLKIETILTVLGSIFNINYLEKGGLFSIISVAVIVLMGWVKEKAK